MIIKALVLPLVLILLEANSCDTTETADHKQATQQEQLAAEANAQVGMPGITRFTEKRLLRQLYELRDQNISTYTYMPDLQGRLWHVCDSVGFGLPYSTQFTNPERPAHNWETQMAGNMPLPQPEPNGLFMPSTAEGTWIMCAGANGTTKPVYVEPRVMVSTIKLKSAGSYQDQ